MSDVYENKSNSVVETSLTELAFIFFFILMVISSWKINELLDDLDKKEQVVKSAEIQVVVLEEKLKEFESSMISLHERLNPGVPFDPDEAFNQVLKLAKGVIKNQDLSDENTELSTLLAEAKAELEVFESIKDKLGEDAVSTIDRYKNIMGELAAIHKNNDVSAEEQLKRVLDEFKNLKGQNLNLRQKLVKLGNGLDHPPCWADPNTGEIQYIFDVVINENKIDVFQGWPLERHAQAIANQNVVSIPGQYAKNSDLWRVSKGLFSESVAGKCRHFVRIYDHADSKGAYKNYLSGVENYFYKYLSKGKYERNSI